MGAAALVLFTAVPLASETEPPQSPAPELELRDATPALRGTGAAPYADADPVGTSPAGWIDFNLSDPPARVWEAMAYDARDDSVLLFGGDGQTNSNPFVPINDTWRFQGERWTEACSGSNATTACPVSPAAGPASMTFDPEMNATLLVDDNGRTWTFAGGAWTELNSSGRPNICRSFDLSGESGSPLAFDPSTGEVVMLDALGYTWTFAGGNWTESASTFPYGEAHDAVLYYDPHLERLVYLTSGLGGVAEYSNGSWILLREPSYPSENIVGGDFDPYLNATVVLTAPRSGTAAGGTWLFRDGTWANVSANLTTEPAPQMFSAMCFDAADGTSILLDGYNDYSASNSDFNYTWQLIDPFIANVSASADVIDVGQNLTLNLSLLGGIPPFNDTISGVPAGCPTPALGIAETCAPTRPGTYLVELSGTDPAINATANATVSITVFPQLASTASAAPRNTTAGFPVVYTGSVSGGDPPYAVAWSFGDGLNSADENCSHTFAVPGVYASNFTVRDALGETLRMETPITVNFPLVLTAFANVSATDVGLPVAFTARPVDGTVPYGYAWTFGDGASASTAVATHAFESAGRFPVGITVSDAVGAIENRSLNVTISPVPTANLTVNDSAPTVGLGVTFVGAVAGGTAPFQYMWSFGDGPAVWINSSSPSVPVPHAFSSAGTFGVQLTVTDAVGVSRETSLLVNVGASGPGGSYGSHPPQGGASPVVNSTDILALASGVGAVVVALVGYFHHRRRGRRGGV